jgi:hypothetical protein
MRIDKRLLLRTAIATAVKSGKAEGGMLKLERALLVRGSP